MIDILKEAPDTPVTFANQLIRGIGYIFLGNLYDNVARPKKLTCIILLCSALFLLLVSDIDY